MVAAYSQALFYALWALPFRQLHPRKPSSPAEEAPEPVWEPTVTLCRGALVVYEVVGVDRDAGLAKESASIVYARTRYALRKGSLDEVVAVPPDAVDAQPRELFFCEAPIQLGRVVASLGLMGEFVAQR